MYILSCLVGCIEVQGKIGNRKCLVLVLVRSGHKNLEVVVLLCFIRKHIREESNVKIDFGKGQIENGAFTSSRVLISRIVALVPLSIAHQRYVDITVGFLGAGYLEVTGFKMLKAFFGQREEIVIIPVCAVGREDERHELIGINLIRQTDDCIC